MSSPTFKIEKWPFILDGYDVAVEENKFYAFGDSGGVLYGRGFYTALQVIERLTFEGNTLNDWSTDPEDLGGVCYCVISGRQFVDRVVAIDAELEDIGRWSE